MSHQNTLTRLACAAALSLALARDALTQRRVPAAVVVPRDSTTALMRDARLQQQLHLELHQRILPGRAAPDSVRSVPERIAGVVGGALFGGATGLAIAAVYAPKIYCELCIEGNPESVARNKWFFRGPVIGMAGGALIGWWFFGRS